MAACRWKLNVSLLPTANLIDVLRVLELSEDMEGVSMEVGLCTERKDTSETDMAYRIDKKIQLSAPTKQFFPGMDSLKCTFTTLQAFKAIGFFWSANSTGIVLYVNNALLFSL